MNTTIAIIGPNESQCTDEIRAFGKQLGKAMADAGFNLVTGGLGGLMQAVFEGAKSSGNAANIRTIGILPGEAKADANHFCDLVIPTGMGIARNVLVVRTGDIVVAVGGGAGTLSEIAFAWQLGKKVICMAGLGGWSGSLAGTALDSRRSDQLINARSVNEVMEAIHAR